MELLLEYLIVPTILLGGWWLPIVVVVGVSLYDVVAILLRWRGRFVVATGGEGVRILIFCKKVFFSDEVIAASNPPIVNIYIYIYIYTDDTQIATYNTTQHTQHTHTHNSTTHYTTSI